MTEKHRSPAFRIVLFLLLASAVAYGQKVSTVVIDAGHGGHDTGALGKNSREKDVALSIALELRDYIRQNLPGVKVVLTRDKDVFVELYRRAKIANESNANLFISIHCNSTKTQSVQGTETFVMGLDKTGANLTVAKAENAAILLEDDYVSRYDGFDPGSPEGNIFFSMMQNAFLNNSLDFAGRVQANFRDRVKMNDRGVKQAGFLVLYKTAMPSVLIECGFLSNSSDEKFLLSPKGQAQIAYAIYKALADYKNGVEKNGGPLITARDSTPVQRTVKEKEVMPVIAEEVKTTAPAVAGNDNAGTPVPAGAVRYRVQFALSKTQMPLDSPEFKGIENVKSYFHNGMYKYTAGDKPSLEEAMQLRRSMVEKGFKDAFVVPFLDENRITNEEAKRLTGNLK
ncbi:MAG TPA: N-acetylmuramoyl-L-alanine amidase [Bacteroidales bacterium]|nr:N-acetylmuramoyl-L-alanine amidase [Bacteroidales bacterium]